MKKMEKNMKKIKNKGFTLVELLAVIVILAVLALIAMPNVLSMMEKSKKSSFVTEAETFAQQLSSAYMSDQVTGSFSNTTSKSLVKDVYINTKYYDYYCLDFNSLKEYISKSNGDDYKGIIELYTLQSSSSTETITVITLTNGDYAINGVSLTNLAKGYTEGNSGDVGKLNSGSTLAQNACAIDANAAKTRGEASLSASQFN